MLSALNLPSPAWIYSIGAVVLIAVIVSRRIKKEGGTDPNCNEGISILFAGLFTELRIRQPLERKLPPISAFTKQLAIFAVCEAALLFARSVLAVWLHDETGNMAMILLFLVVFSLGLMALMWWDVAQPSESQRQAETQAPSFSTPRGR